MEPNGTIDPEDQNDTIEYYSTILDQSIILLYFIIHSKLYYCDESVLNG